MTDTTFHTQNRDGVPFTVRLVRKGERWGLDRCLTHHDDIPLVVVYDARYTDGRFDPLGQQVSTYSADTLLERDDPETTYGINLDGGVPAWYIDADPWGTVLAWLLGEIFPDYRVCSACHLRDATPGEDDGLCSECFAAAQDLPTISGGSDDFGTVYCTQCGGSVKATGPLGEHTCRFTYAERCHQASDQQGITPVIAALTEADIPAFAEQTGGFVIVGTVYGKDGWWLGVTETEEPDYDADDNPIPGWLVCVYDAEESCEGETLATAAPLAEVVALARIFVAHHGAREGGASEIGA